MRESVSKLLKSPKKLHDRIQDRLTLELQRQKDDGKKFISNEEIDAIIDDIIKDEIDE